MNREFSDFSLCSPLNPIDQPWSRLVSLPFHATTPGFSPQPRATVRPAQPEISQPTTPDQQLAKIIEFIDTTTRLSASQLRWLSFLERSVESSEHHDLNGRIEETINTNELILTEAIMQLTRQGKPVKIGHPQTGQSVPIIGLRYSTEQLGYQVAIPEPAPAPPTLVSLFVIDQLHL